MSRLARVALATRAMLIPGKGNLRRSQTLEQQPSYRLQLREASAVVADDTGDENQGNRAHWVGSPGRGVQKHPRVGEGG